MSNLDVPQHIGIPFWHSQAANWQPFGCVIRVAIMANKKAETRVSPEVQDYLRDLLDTGAYGSTDADVVRTLIEAGIRDAIARNIIPVRRASRTGGKN